MPRLPMWGKQKDALKTMIHRAKRGRGTPLFAKMGTGKTRIMVHLLEWFFATNRANLVYIAGPLSALHVWVENWHEWATVPVAFIDLHKHGSSGIDLAERLVKGGWPVICLVNYESSWQIGRRRVKRKRGGEDVTVLENVSTTLASLDWDVGILDESSAIKTPGSRASKFFRMRMAKKTKYRFVMNGTPYKKRLIDVWAQVNFATGTEVFPNTFGAFRAMYAIPHPTIPRAIVGYQNVNDFVRKLSKVAILIEKRDVFDLADPIHSTRLVNLSAKNQDFYDELKDEMYAELEDMEEQGITVTASHIFTLGGKLAQITSGFIYPDADPDTPEIKPPYKRLGREKLDVLLDLLDAREDPTVIVTQYNPEEEIIASAIRKRFGFMPKVLNGSVKHAEERHEMIKAASKDLAFIVKQSVGARGVDMRWADTLIFYSHNYDTDAYDQMLSRNHRGGQTEQVYYIHILCRDTVDTKIMRALKRDMRFSDSVDRNWRDYL